MILFAGFYIEATLNYLRDRTRKRASMRKFLRKRYPGMQDKLAWFYNEFIARAKAPTKEALYKRGIKSKLRRKFPGFAELHRFRNDISHGEVNRCAASLATAQRLRQNAKDLVAELYSYTARAGFEVPRIVTYQDAITFFGNLEPSIPCR